MPVKGSPSSADPVDYGGGLRRGYPLLELNLLVMILMDAIIISIIKVTYAIISLPSKIEVCIMDTDNSKCLLSGYLVP